MLISKGDGKISTASYKQHVRLSIGKIKLIPNLYYKKRYCIEKPYFLFLNNINNAPKTIKMTLIPLTSAYGKSQKYKNDPDMYNNIPPAIINKPILVVDMSVQQLISFSEMRPGAINKL